MIRTLGSADRVGRIEDDDADRFAEQVGHLPSVLDVVVGRAMRFERVLVPVALEQMEGAARVALLVEVVPLAAGLGPRSLHHPPEERTELRLPSGMRMERCEHGDGGGHGEVAVYPQRIRERGW
jgi:hypothetical protein